MGKYDALSDYLLRKDTNSVTLSFEEIEKIIGDELPQSAHRYVQWWSNNESVKTRQCKAWLSVGYKTTDLGSIIEKQTVTFEKY